MKERDKFENTHTCYVSQSKEEKGNDKIYVGKGREIVFNNNQEKSKPNVSYQQPKPEPMPEVSSEPADDLPF